jgi:hypothetical protein
MNSPNLGPAIGATLVAPTRAWIDAARLPFDAAREVHAWAVRAGLLRRSMIEARDFEHFLGATEGLALGWLARRL